MKKKIAILVLLLGVASGGVWVYRSNTGTETQNAVAAPTEAVVAIGNIETVVTAQGTLEPRDYVDVGAQVSGLIEKMHVDIGDTVRQGDMIAEIDPDVYEAKVKADQARLKTLQAEKIEQEALAKQAQQKLERNKKLYGSKAVSKEIFEDTQTDFDVANAKILSLEAQIEEQQSSLDGDQTNLGYTKIYAPMDGTVVAKSVEEGQTINANQSTPTIVQVADLDTMTVKAEVAEADVMKLHPGMPMYFTTLGSGERKWHGQVRQILPTPETKNDVVLYNVLVDIDNKDRVLMSGMTTQMFFIVAKAENAPLVPVSALRRRLPDSDTKDGQAYEVEVKGAGLKTVIVGASDRLQAAVLDGLSAGDTVIVSSGQGGEDKTTTTKRTPRLRGMARL